MTTNIKCGNHKKFQNLQFLVLIFMVRLEAKNIISLRKKKQTLVGINSSLDTAEGNISELKNIAI